MALHTPPANAKTCAGIAGFSGALRGADLLTKEVTVKPPVCLIHGKQDMMVPLETMAATEKALKGQASA